MSVQGLSRGGVVIATIGALACAQGEKPSAEETARDLTLTPAETAATLRDAPAPQAEPAPRPEAKARPPAAPVAPALLTLVEGTRFEVAASDTLSSRTARVGEPFTASVVGDVKDGRGRIVLPAGATVRGKITDVKPAPNPNEPGTLTLALSSVTVRGTDYPLEARIDSLETVHKGRGVTGGDAAKVGAGAAAGAILGRVVGGDKKGTIIGGVVGAVAGAGVAAATKDSDIVLPQGAHVHITLTKPLSVQAT